MKPKDFIMTVEKLEKQLEFWTNPNKMKVEFENMEALATREILDYLDHLIDERNDETELIDLTRTYLGIRLGYNLQSEYMLDSILGAIKTLEDTLDNHEYSKHRHKTYGSGYSGKPET